MPERITDGLELALLISLNAPAGQVGTDFNPDRWISDKRNIALRIGHDLGMFEHCGPGVTQGHCFFESRGKQAKANARAMMEQVGGRIIGEVPVWRRDVRLFMAGLGFRTVGEAIRPLGRVWIMERKPELNPAPSHDRTAVSLA